MFTDFVVAEQTLKSKVGLSLPSDTVFDLEEKSEKIIIDWLKLNQAPAALIDLASILPMIYLYGVKSAENTLTEQQAAHLTECYVEAQDALKKLEKVSVF
jgi:hypothetical protein